MAWNPVREVKERIVMLEGQSSWNHLTDRILGACFAVHSELGAGLLESVYDDALALELTERGLCYSRQELVPVRYRGQRVGDPFRLDFWVEGKVIIELKAVEAIHPIHRAQLITYLKLTKSPIGLLINFHVPRLKEGIERMMNTRATGGTNPRTDSHFDRSDLTP